MQDQVSGIVTTTTLLDAMKICTKTQVCEARPLLKQRNSSVSIEWLVYEFMKNKKQYVWTLLSSQ